MCDCWCSSWEEDKKARWNMSTLHLKCCIGRSGSNSWMTHVDPVYIGDFQSRLAGTRPGLPRWIMFAKSWFYTCSSAAKSVTGRSFSRKYSAIDFWIGWRNCCWTCQIKHFGLVQDYTLWLDSPLIKALWVGPRLQPCSKRTWDVELLRLRGTLWLDSPLIKGNQRWQLNIAHL